MLNSILNLEEIERLLKEAGNFKTITLKWRLYSTVKKLLDRHITTFDVLMSIDMSINENGEIILDEEE